MLVDLNIKDIISLVNTTIPHYGLLDDLRVRPYGEMSIAPYDTNIPKYARWAWNNKALNKLSEEELFSLYNLCK